MIRRPRFPGTLVIAIGLACLMWYATALERRERISERQIDASVTLVNVPQQLAVTSDVPRTVTVRVRGPLRRLQALDPAQTGVVIDLRAATEGETEFPVESRNVLVPEGVQVIAVSPAEIPLRLEPLIQRRVPVREQIVGTPAAGFVLGPVTVDPPFVIVSGPRSQVEGLRSLVADPIDVTGAQGPIERMVTVRSPAPLMRVEFPLAVRMRVDVHRADDQAVEGKVP